MRLLQGGGRAGGAPAEEELHAWLDGALEPDGASRLEGRLSLAPDQAARAMAYRAQISGLHALYDPILNEPIPERLMAPLRQVRPAERPKPQARIRQPQSPIAQAPSATARTQLPPLWPAVAAAALTAAALGTLVLADGGAAMVAVL